ncbi:unnamed protein product [Thelazia callipaeda]|uniref:PDZ domain-containing protein n=1 Tax=Thelazia callipaeda TaxID=103827 RepID=A0A0N5D234_THECL|nr:unnamed protein product [Thelazia callipaeda]
MSTDTVMLKKPLGLRISKHTLEVTYIEESGASMGQVSIGDIIVAVDRQKVASIQELNKILGHPSPVQIALRRSEMVDVNELLGLSVKYDAKERIQVTSTAKNSLSSIHLRPGDIIREVNDCPIASKTMLDYYIQEGVIESGQINFTIESLAGGADAYRDQVELANDVLEIARKQIAQFTATLSASEPFKLSSILRKKSVNNKSKKVAISDEFAEFPIGADYDPSRLKPCKHAINEMKNLRKYC